MNVSGMRMAMAVVLFCLSAAPLQSGFARVTHRDTSFAISFPAARSRAPLDGRVILERIASSAPAGADLTSWRY